MFKSEWYNNLIQPPLAPPSWIFAPVWTILYTTIFVSLVLYITKPNYDKKWGYIFFSVQMILNLLWTPAFFIWKNILLALVIIVIMDIFVILMLRKFYEVSKISALILVPYFLWIIFATYLNIGYLVLNFK